MHNIGTVPMFKMHNIGTVPMFKMLNVGRDPKKFMIFVLSWKFGFYWKIKWPLFPSVLLLESSGTHFQCLPSPIQWGIICMDKECISIKKPACLSFCGHFLLSVCGHFLNNGFESVREKYRPWFWHSTYQIRCFELDWAVPHSDFLD